MIADQIRKIAEDENVAVPIYGCMPLDMNEKGIVVGYLSQVRMGEATRIGAIGKNGLLVHARYGSRLMLGGVLTTAVLPKMCYPDVSLFVLVVISNIDRSRGCMKIRKREAHESGKHDRT